MTETSEGADDSTFDTAKTVRRGRDLRYLGLSILCHPDWTRIGERARLLDPGTSGELSLTRTAPMFRDALGRRPRPLATQRVSRLPIQLELRADGSLSLRAPRALELSVDDKRVEEESSYGAEQLRTGLLLQLGKYVLLRLAFFEDAGEEPEHLPELVGTSAAMRKLREELARVSDLEIPVRLRGEPGAGKQRVAAALHRASPRRGGPYYCLNLAELEPARALAELFGHAGEANAPREGYFAAADGGTLCLHQIEAASSELQGLLLRALESSSVQPLGGQLRSVSVRLITASDADLERSAQEGQFNPALLRRLGYAIHVPSLRERADDVAELLAHFVQEQLAELEREGAATPPREQKPLLNAELVTQLVRYAWPGNLRQLREVAHQLALQQRGGPHTRARDPLGELVPRPAAPAAVSSSRRGPLTLGEQDIVAALARCAYQIDRTARELGVSRSWLHARIDNLPAVRKAKDLSRPEIRAALDETQGELSAAALALKVSPKGLQLQMKRLGLGGGRARHGG